LGARRALTSAERGTAAHAFLERLPIQAHTLQSLEAARGSQLAAGYLTPQQAQSLPLAGVAAFFASPLGRRLIAAQQVRREFAFNCHLPAKDILGAATKESILLQGVIDCCFLEDGAWVLLDYKTDALSPGLSLAQETQQKHARQLALYARALKTTTDRPVKEAYVILLKSGESVGMGL
jgi:ATP-dependent helicase/nuclease subunit A